MKYFFSFVSIVFLTGCLHNHSPELIMVQFTDRNGVIETISSKERLKNMAQVDFCSPQPYQKILRVFQKNQANVSRSTLTNYHPNGNLYQYLEIQNARAKGLYREWYPSGEKRIEAIIIGGPAELTEEAQKQWLFDGVSRVWDDRGHLCSEILYNQGELVGEAKYFFPSGALKKIIPYQNSKIHGDILEYAKEGYMISRSHYEQGKREGPSFVFFMKDQVASMEEYSQDLLNQGQYFDRTNQSISSIQHGEGTRAIFSNGVLFQLIEYHRGMPDGVVKEFSFDGSLHASHTIKKGQKHGEELVYYSKDESENKSTHIPKISIIWNEGEVHGMMKTWFSNGNIESQRQMCHNKKNGPYCAWYLDGSIMLIEDYENDLLLKGRYYQRKETIPISQVDGGNGLATIFDENGAFLRKITYQNGMPQEP